jgi:hypothetical protein
VRSEVGRVEIVGRWAERGERVAIMHKWQRYGCRRARKEEREGKQGHSYCWPLLVLDNAGAVLYC